MQGVLDFQQGLPARPPRPDRLFFAVFRDAKSVARFGEFQRRFLHGQRLPGNPLGTERLHVSLHHVGDYQRLRGKFVYAARQAGKAIAMRSCLVTFRAIASFEGARPRGGRPHRRPLVLLGEGEALRALHEALGAAMEKNGLKAAAHFTPHMTLSYSPRRIATRSIEPIRFLARELVLIHSELWRTRYNILGRWPLRD